MSGIRVVVQMYIEPENEAALRTAWLQAYDTANAEAGCLQYELFQSTTTPTRFALLEHWQDQETYDAHWAAESKRTSPYGHLLSDFGGCEFYCEHRYYIPKDGKWTPIEDD